jgi:hypothetical protein
MLGSAVVTTETLPAVVTSIGLLPAVNTDVVSQVILLSKTRSAGFALVRPLHVVRSVMFRLFVIL